MASKIQPGKYIGQIIDYSMRRTANGDPEPIIRFKWLDKDRDQHEYNWRGSLKEGKAREITLKTLLTCGFSGDDLSVLCDGVESRALDTEQQVNLSIELQPGKDGNEYPTIAWVNPISGNGFSNEISRDEARAKLAMMNIGNDLGVLRSQQKTQIKKSVSSATASTPALDDIPF